jgi:hypothetical protein
VAISPDGSRIAYVSRKVAWSRGSSFLRLLENPKPTVLVPGLGGPFFRPMAAGSLLHHWDKVPAPQEDLGQRRCSVTLCETGGSPREAHSERGRQVYFANPQFQ